jgi:hypothetical protein|tara:strand:+ start:40 stop:579 length:540 start_codon:yes stop_codon:yes gene_type:complete
MPKLQNLNIIYSSLILTILILTAAIPQALQAEEEEELGETIYNYQVHFACDNWLNPDTHKEKEMDESDIKFAGFICGIYLGMVQEQNQYHEAFINYFTKNNDQEAVDFAHSYTITGCNIISLSHRAFAELYLKYMANNEESMDWGFLMVLNSTLKPYCDAMRNKNIDFYLNESGDRRRT